MKQKTKLIFTISLVLLFFSVLPKQSFAADDKLLYDLNYDEQKSVLFGKTKPNANIFINDLAGSIVANEKGEFEVPIPKGLKMSTVLMLDAEGDTSTDLQYDFEKNTIETDSTQQGEDSSTSSQSQEEKKAPASKKDENESVDSTKESGVSETSNQESQTKDSAKKTDNSISSESYNIEDEVVEKRSLVWLWTLLIVLAVIGSAVGVYFWYKKKIEKEESAKKASRKRSAKKKKSRKLDDDFEEDLYASLKEPKKGNKNATKNRPHKEKKEKNLDELIESELKKSDSSKHRSKKNSSSSTSKSRKKKSRKSGR